MRLQFDLLADEHEQAGRYGTASQYWLLAARLYVGSRYDGEARRCKSHAARCLRIRRESRQDIR